MTFRQIELVQSSFRLVQSILDDAMVLFYDRLFELDPSLRAMFKSSREEQRRKPAQTLTMVVKGLDRPDQIRAARIDDRDGRRQCCGGNDVLSVGADGRLNRQTMPTYRASSPTT